jgi:hypothetical protein
MSTAQIGQVTPNYKRSKEPNRGMLKKLILKWADAIYQKENKVVSSEIDRDTSIRSERGINFRVYKASGGTVIETQFYDDLKDRSRRGLYVITDEQDMGREIAKIITVESLKQ